MAGNDGANDGVAYPRRRAIVALAALFAQEEPGSGVLTPSHSAACPVVFTPPEKTDIRSRVEHLAGGLRGASATLTSGLLSFAQAESSPGGSRCRSPRASPSSIRNSGSSRR